MQPEAISPHPIAGYLGEQTNRCLTTASSQVAVESDKVSPQPPLLQTEQPQLQSAINGGKTRVPQSQWERGAEGR